MEGNLTEQRNLLRSRIRAWEQIQAIYMPGLLQFRHDLSTRRPSTVPSLSGNPEDLELWLPSKLPANKREQICVQGLSTAEDKLHTAQCHDSLDSIRHILTIKTRMVQFKNKNIRGQREGTRSRAVIDRVHGRARAAADKYRAARKAKLELAGHGDWELVLQELKDEDIRSYQDPTRLQPRQPRRGILDDEQLASLEERLARGNSNDSNNVQDQLNFTLFNEQRSRRDGTGETRRKISWIWLNQQLGVGAGDDLLRSEWAKSRARAERGREEVLLIKEEMRRTLESLTWEAEEWKKRALKRTEQVKLESGLKEGLHAYALRQSDIQTHLAVHFRSLWDSPLDDATEDINVPPNNANSNAAPDTDIVDDDEGFGSDVGDDDTYDQEEDD